MKANEQAELIELIDLETVLYFEDLEERSSKQKEK
jgi:hypothetical protein